MSYPFEDSAPFQHFYAGACDLLFGLPVQDIEDRVWACVREAPWTIDRETSEGKRWRPIYAAAVLQHRFLQSAVPQEPARGEDGRQREIARQALDSTMRQVYEAILRPVQKKALETLTQYASTRIG